MDESIHQAKVRMGEAKKAITEARAAARNDKRKKARLVRKASALSSADLDRIKVLKRCGLSLPHDDVPVCIRDAAPGSASAGSGEGAPAQEREEEQAAPTEDEPDDESGGEDDREGDGKANKQTPEDLAADTRNE